MMMMMMMMIMIEEESGFHLVEYCASFSSLESTPLELHHAHNLYDNVVDHGDDDVFEDVDDHGDDPGDCDHEEKNIEKSLKIFLILTSPSYRPLTRFY